MIQHWIMKLFFKNRNIFTTLGGSVGTINSTGTVPTSLKYLRIGSAINSSYLNGHIKHIAYFPRSLSQSETRTLTSV